MGRALIGGLLHRGTRPGELQVGEMLPEARTALTRDFGLTAAADNRAAARGAAVVVLAVKPADVAGVLQELAGELAAARPLVVSVVAGVRIATLAAACGPGVPVLRAMPNRPALLGAGITGLYAPPGVAAAERAVAADVLQAVGEIVWVGAEAALDVVTALSGSGPAYFFLLAELMAEAGEQLGLPQAIARRLAAVTLHGAGRLVQSGDADLARLRQEVTSRGGTTEAALQVLEAAGLRSAVYAALAAATQRSRELAEGTA